MGENSMIRIYGENEETLCFEKGKSYFQKIKINLDEKVFVTIGESLDILIDFLSPNWGFDFSPAEDIEWEMRLRPFKKISMLLEIDCPNETELKYKIIGV